SWDAQPPDTSTAATAAVTAQRRTAFNELPLVRSRARCPACGGHTIKGGVASVLSVRATLAQPNTSATGALLDSGPSGPGESAGKRGRNRMRVLVVEDEPYMAEALQAGLRQE